jgi:cytochrome b561
VRFLYQLNDNFYLLSSRWFYAHWFIQFIVAGPIIFAGWALGYKSNADLETGRFQDIHERIGLTVLILYLIQLFIGAFVHFFKFPTLFRGHRAPHNYLHVLVGFTIIVLAQYNVCFATIIIPRTLCLINYFLSRYTMDSTLNGTMQPGVFIKFLHPRNTPGSHSWW